MMISSPRLLGLAALLAGAFALLLPREGISFQQDDDLPPPKFHIDPRGPVHEAFAQPNEPRVDMTKPIQKAPPPPLPEEPPEMRPDNPNAEWIPGYWAWDADRNDFVWVTGTFRNAPPGRRWVPGHWANDNNGWSWVPGFWAGANQQNVPLTPQPPAPLEDGPTGAAPDENSGWIPGYWYYNQAEERFAWRPGYWAPFRDDRIWVAPQYFQTPNGYCYNDGYWDYPLGSNGLLFAPAYFPTPLWNTPGWTYRPTYAVGINPLLASLFYMPRYGHYYFGNYYGPHYAGLGYRPWWGGGYNNNFAYARWQNRANPNWAGQQQQLFADRAAGRVGAPPMTFAQQQTAVKAGATPMVTPLSRYTPASGKLVANTNIAAQNFQIRNTHDLANARAASMKSSVGATSLHLPPSPPMVRPPGAASPAAAFHGGPPHPIGQNTLPNYTKFLTPAHLPNATPQAIRPAGGPGLSQVPNLNRGTTPLSQPSSVPHIVNGTHPSSPQLGSPQHYNPSMSPTPRYGASVPHYGGTGVPHYGGAGVPHYGGMPRMGGAPHVGGGMPHVGGGGVHVGGKR